MSQEDIDVLGIDNAIVDIFATPDNEELIETLKLHKGSMNIIDADKSSMLYSCLHSTKEMSGGTVANTLAGLRSFGGTSAFIGKVGNDIFGERFVYELKQRKILSEISLSNGDETSRSFIIVTPDGTRTMCTYLNNHCYLSQEDINIELIKRSRMIYLSSYILDTENGKEILQYVTDTAKSNNKQVALALADKKCVERHREFLFAIIEKNVDFVFANKAEINALYDNNDINLTADSLTLKTRELPTTYAITLAAEGAVFINKGEIVTVPTDNIDKITDKTGAGAVFASGVLYGHLHGYELVESGKLGNKAASEIIQVIGARPSNEFILLLDGNNSHVDDSYYSEW